MRTLTSKKEWCGRDGSSWLWLKLREKWSFLILWAEFSPHLSQSLITSHIFKCSVLILIGHLNFITICNYFIFSKVEIEITQFFSVTDSTWGYVCVCACMCVCTVSIALTQRILLRNMLEGIDQSPVGRFLCKYHLVMWLHFACLKCDLSSALSWNWLMQLDHMTSGWL